MNERALKALEYGRILQRVAAFASSSAAKESIIASTPIADYERVSEMLNEVEEAERAQFEFSVYPSFNIDSIGSALDRAEVLSVLTMGELLKISRVMRIARNAKTAIEKIPCDEIVLLKRIASGIFINKKLEDEIENAIVSDTEMSDNASPELRNIRTKIRKIGDAIKSKLQNYVHSSAYSKFIQDSIVTMRNDRYVIPVKAEYRKEIAGLIHDQSASGATVYIEPMVIVELNNDLKTLILDEEKEIDRILRAFTVKVAAEASAIRFNFEVLIRLDVIFAKAAYAEKTKSKKQNLNKKGYIKILKGRHPLIDPEKVVPTSVDIGDTFDVLLITGPNTGGKTVSLKLLGLFVLLTETGIFLPAEEADVFLFEEVFCDIGDEQSIEQSLSTFSSHMSNIVSILDKVSSESLVLLDELGAGTDPAEGASLALSICDYIKNTGAKSVITTHYNELKEYGVVTEGVENASMDFDPTDCRPTYKLIVGTPGASNALLIAERLGLDKNIIQKAREGLKSQKVQFENVLTALETARKNAEESEEKARENLKATEKMRINVEKERDRLIAERAKIDEIVRREKKKLIADAVEEANEIIEELRSLLDEPDESAIFRAHKLRSSLKKYAVDDENGDISEILEDKGEISVGDSVYVVPLKNEGKVLSLNPIKGDARIQLGQMSTVIKIKDLKKVEPKPEKRRAESRRLPRTESVSSELKLLGKTVSEALSEIDGFISQAMSGGLTEIKIIHGYGTGALRKAVQAYLKESPYIESIRDGKYGEGERGVTFAILK